MAVLYLCGAGNPEAVRLALRVNRRQFRWGEIVLLDDLPHNQGRSILGVRVVGPISTLAQADGGRAEVVNLVAGTTARRRLVRRRIEGCGVPFTPLIDPGVDVEGVRHGRDVVVFQNAVVAAEAALGEGSVVSMGAVVGHECVVGEDCFISPNAVLNGRVCLGDGVFVGANAAVLPGVRVGAWATVGACSLVVRDVPERTTVVGVPARAFTTRPADPLMNQELRNSGKEALNFLIS
jgi:sugar O-acyltransferase (sialic acid O-acetyltransferase NeuD family)